MFGLSGLWELAAKAAIALAVVGLIAWGVNTYNGHFYGKGFAAGKAESDLVLQTAVAVSEKSRADSLQKLMVAQAEVVRIEAETAQREAAALVRGRKQVKAVERGISENPQFAATVRPADLGGVRDEQLADIAAAANRSAELSAASLRGVRAPDAE
jgi:hypothetical protein